jgi:predicted Zn finger-like uncharacterized protein
MIIQCKQCRTKFRFDDSHMQGSGIWLRCSRCGHVYFQENPLAKKLAIDSLLEDEPEPIIRKKDVIPAEEVIHAEEKPKTTVETPSVFHRDEEGQKSLDRIMAIRKRMRAEADLDIEKPPENIADEETQPLREAEDIEKEAQVEITQEKKNVRGSGKAWKIILWSFFVIVAIPGIFYYFVFFAYPEFGEQILNGRDNLIKIVNEYRGVSEPVTSGTFINQMVKLQDIRYRRVNNYILGQIGVLEGNAVNRAEFPLSRIHIKGEIVDAYSVVLGERSSYAGNILTDEELINLSEEEILMKLLRPEGINNTNDKIIPNGQIPFMIIFPNEPSGVIKTTVVTIGAERLLSE